MVEDREIDRFSGPGQPAGCPAVGVARPRIAARMIVRNNEARAAQFRSVGDDPADRHGHGGGLTFIMFDVDASGRAVDMRHQQLLTAPILIFETGSKKAARSLMPIEECR